MNGPRVYFSTVVRGGRMEESGEVVLVDWAEKRVVRRVPIYPTDPPIDDPNPNGNARGGRGIQLMNGSVVVASYHTLKIFDPELRLRRDVSHGLLAGLHEGFPVDDDRLWVASTALDAAVEIDLRDGSVGGQAWPRERAEFQRALGLEPLEIDKDADNRRRFLARSFQKSASHLHLNAVAIHDGNLFALLNGPGCIVNLTRCEIVVRNPHLQGAHNLVFDDRGAAIVNDTRGRAVRIYDVRLGRPVRSIDLMVFPQIRRLLRRGRAVNLARKGLRATKLTRKTAPRPLWVRGLDRSEGRLYVGISPAAVLCLDETTGDLIEIFAYSSDARVCVHGLKVAV
jgi:hypothetical protein